MQFAGTGTSSCLKGLLKVAYDTLKFSIQAFTTLICFPAGFTNSGPQLRSCNIITPAFCSGNGNNTTPVASVPTCNPQLASSLIAVATAQEP